MRIATPLAIGAAIVALAACGHDAKGPSKDAFTSKATVICADANQKQSALGLTPGWEDGRKFSDPKVLSRFSAIGHDALRELRGLTPPDDQRGGVARTLSAIGHSLSVVDRQLDAVRAGRSDQSDENAEALDSAFNDVAAAGGANDLSQCEGIAI